MGFDEVLLQHMQIFGEANDGTVLERDKILGHSLASLAGPAGERSGSSACKVRLSSASLPCSSASVCCSTRARSRSCAGSRTWV